MAVFMTESLLYEVSACTAAIPHGCSAKNAGGMAASKGQSQLESIDSCSLKYGAIRAHA